MTVKHLGSFVPEPGDMPAAGQSRYLLHEDRELTDNEVAVHFGKHADTSAVRSLGFRMCTAYKLIDKTGKGHIWAPEETYPIISIKNGEYQKLLFRAETDKAKRFKLCHNQLPDDYVVNLDALRMQWDLLNDNSNAAKIKLKELGIKDTRFRKMHRSGGDLEKWPSVTICCGDRDAANVASTGEMVVWRNSEGLMPASSMALLDEMFHEIYYVGDLDTTGKKKAHQNCERYLDIKRIYLPESLMLQKDLRGHQMKDATDFISTKGRAAFKAINNMARPYKVFSYKIKVGSAGQFVSATAEVVKDYIGPFLREQGFFWIKEEPDLFLVHRIGNVMQKTTVGEVRRYLIDFYEARNYGLQVRELLKRTAFIKQAVEEDLPLLQNINTKTGAQDHQVFVFPSVSWKITADGIGIYRPGELENIVFQDQVIAPKIKSNKPLVMKVEKPYFEVKINEEGKPKGIEVTNKDVLMLQFLADTSRVHWRNEFSLAVSTGLITDAERSGNLKVMREKKLDGIDGHLLTPQQRVDQQMHLLSKLCDIGYMCHVHKKSEHAFISYAFDEQIKSVRKSEGRTGKSLTTRLIRIFNKSINENGRDPKMTERPHICGTLTRHHSLVVVQDVIPWLTFGYFYPPATDTWTVNPKGKDQREIVFEESAKIRMESNMGPPPLDGSTMGRLFLTVFTDFFHQKISEQKFEVRKPGDYYSQQLFDGFTTDQWVQTFNLVAQCVQLYLRYGKIEAPLDLILKRDAANEVGDKLMTWLDSNCLILVNGPDGKGKIPTDPDSLEDILMVDPWVAKEIAGEIWINSKALYSQYKEENNDRDMSQTKFNDRFSKWATSIHGYEFNPEGKQQKGRELPLKSFITEGGQHKNVQSFYLRKPAPNTNQTIEDYMSLKPEEKPY